MGNERANEKQSQGFTMIEVIVVIVIIGVLAAIAMPSYRIQMLKVKNQEAVRILTVLWEAQKDYFRDNGPYFAGDVNTVLNFAVTIPTPKNFQDVVADDGTSFVDCGGLAQNYLASIQDSTGIYTLYVLTDGRIVCTPCPGSLCTKMGFPTW